ncbi:MAG TPA: hypothetical protein VI282_06250, partial [Verrucomicrobiae bacterium]
MRKAIFILSVFAIGASSLAQTSSDGLIIFRNINIATSQPNPDLPGYIAGSNGNGTYNVPIYTDYSGNGGAGLLPGGVTVGLFTEASPVPVATGLLGTQANTAAFIVTPVSQTVTVTGYPPGSTPTLVIRAWQSSFGTGWDGFNAAKAAGSRWAEWNFVSPPLGGTPAGGGAEIPTPTMTGWGNPSGNGVSLALLSPISFTR